MRKFNYSMVALLVATMLTNPVFAQQTKRNLVANGNFEDGASHWRFQYFEGADASLSVDETTPISGDKSAQIEVNANGTNPWSSMFYYLFPVENEAKYKITWKAKSTQNFNLHFEICQKHDEYAPLTATEKSTSFISDNAAVPGLLRGTIALTSEVQEYTFITDGSQLPDGAYMLAFHFGQAPVGATIWIDDVKISRCDAGDWDGNLAPWGNFEQVTPVQKCGDDDTYKVACCISDAGISAGDYIDVATDEINTGQSFHAYLGASTGFWDFAPWFAWYANENCTYTLNFNAKSDKDGARMSVRTATAPWARGSKNGDHLITDPSLTTSAQPYSMSMANGIWGDNAGATSNTFDSGANATYFGLQKCFISLSEPGFAQSSVNFWIDDFKIFEDDLKLEDFDLLNVPATMTVGQKVQMKVGEFVKPTHAPCTIFFEVTDGDDFAEIDDEGNIEALAPGTVKFTASDAAGNVEKEFSFTVTGNVAVENPTENKTLSIYPTVVKTGAVITLSESADYEIYNTNGELVFNENNKNLISTQNLVSGIYFAKIKKGKETATSRFVVR